MRMETALKKAKDGEFEFIYDAKNGSNQVRYRTSLGKWKEKTIEITGDNFIPYFSKSKGWVDNAE